MATTSKSFHESLRARPDDWLADLLALRPDLAHPAPASIGALAARAGSRAGVERAVARLDIARLAVLESVTALSAAAETSEVSEERVFAGFGINSRSHQAQLIQDALADLEAHALIWGDGKGWQPAPAVAEVLGAYPAGLGPSFHDALSALPNPRLAELYEDLVTSIADDQADADDPSALSRIAAINAHLADPETLADYLAQAPQGARRLLDALAWGPPVGQIEDANRSVRVPQATTAVDWLLARGLLYPIDPSHVVLPHEVALHLRDGRTHLEYPSAPPPPNATAVAAEESQTLAALAAAEFARRVSELIAQWKVSTPAVLKSGGVGLRDIKALARRLGATDVETSLVAEVAYSALLVADASPSGPASDQHHWVATAATEIFQAGTLAQRWAILARQWLASQRTPWLVGTRDTKGELRAALSFDLERNWAPQLRRQILEVLAAYPGQALDSVAVVAQLGWTVPRALPQEWVVSAILTEAEQLGITGHGALSSAGLAVLRASSEDADDYAFLAPASMFDPGTKFPLGQITQTIANELETALPPEVDVIHIQEDLSALVPGRPTAELVELLDTAAEVQSRGVETVYRFTEASIRRALDRDGSVDQLLEGLARHSPQPLPEALVFVISDAAKRHGTMRAGAAGGYVRCEDERALAALVADPAFAPLQLHLIAPTVVVSQAPIGSLLEVLNSRGLTPLVEGPDGRPVERGQGRRRLNRRRILTASRPPVALASEPERLAAVEAMRIGEARVAAVEVPQNTASSYDPAVILARLRDAIASSSAVTVILTGPEGTQHPRKVRPLAVDGGRLRALDLSRSEEEILVTLSRIASVT